MRYLILLALASCAPSIEPGGESVELVEAPGPALVLVPAPAPARTCPYVGETLAHTAPYCINDAARCVWSDSWALFPNARRCACSDLPEGAQEPCPPECPRIPGSLYCSATDAPAQG